MSSVLMDSAVAIVIVLSALFALMRGFVREMLTILNLVAAGFASYVFAKDLMPVTDRWLGATRAGESEGGALLWGVIPAEVMSTILSYSLIFFIVFFVLTLAGLYIAGVIKSLGLGPVDRVLGLAFGALRGFLIAFLIYLPFGHFIEKDRFPAWAQESISLPWMHKTYDRFVKPYLEEDAAEESSLDPIREDAAENVTDQIRGNAAETPSPATPAPQDLLTDEEFRIPPQPSLEPVLP